MPEREIQMVREGKPGQIATTAQPMDRRSITISEIVPQGTPKEGSNTFKVYAGIDDPISPDWRPARQAKRASISKSATDLDGGRIGCSIGCA